VAGNLQAFAYSAGYRSTAGPRHPVAVTIKKSLSHIRVYVKGRQSSSLLVLDLKTSTAQPTVVLCRRDYRDRICSRWRCLARPSESQCSPARRRPPVPTDLSALSLRMGRSSPPGGVPCSCICCSSNLCLLRRIFCPRSPIS
jgi:hypothetical protein